MAQHLEIELKSMLTSQEFHRLLNHWELSSQAPLIQDNAYYDTATRSLKHLHAALRLRNFTSTSEWTIKQAQSDTHALELTQLNHTRITNIPSSLSEHLIHNVALLNFLRTNQIDLQTLYLTTQFTTKRWEFHSSNGTYCLDETTYGNITDYELELETTDLEAATSDFQTLLTQLKIPYRVADKKIARAFQYAQ